PAHHLRLREVLRGAADLPDSAVGAAPDVADQIGDATEHGAGVLVDGVSAATIQPRSLEQISVDIELELFERAVADAHRPRTSVARQRRDIALDGVRSAIEPV